MNDVINLTEMAKGALQEQFENNFHKVLDNMEDPNTDPKKMRKLSITMKIIPAGTTGTARIEFQTDIKLVPQNALETQIAFGKEQGKTIVREFGGDIPGQYEMTEDGEIEDNTKLVSIGGKK